MRAIILGLVIFWASLAGPADAQADVEDEGPICVTVAHLWAGTVEDVRRIHVMPIPESYRQEFESGGCTRFSLVEETLIDWHLAFGDEATATTALAYLEADHVRGAPGTAVLPHALARARREARRDSLIAEPGLAATGSDYQRADRVFAHSLSVRRVRALVLARGSYLFLARVYVRAAEFYGSAALLAKARLYLAPVRESLAQLGAPDPAVARAEDRLGLWPERMDELDDLEMRLAVLQARLGTAGTDIAAAERLVESYDNPAVQLAADHAYQHGDDFCDTDEGNELAPMRVACEADDGFESRVISYWRARAQLDLLTVPRDPGREPDSADKAINLLEHGRVAGLFGSSPRFGGGDADILVLRMARAALYIQLAAAMRSEAAGEQAQYEAAGQEQIAFAELDRAERLVSPAVAPQWFRRIAEAYLALAASIQAREAADPEHRAFVTVDRRRLAYYGTLLANLDRIAVGDPAPR